MGCNCKKQEPVSVFSPIVTIPVITMVPESTPLPVEDWYNNIDIIEPKQDNG